MAMERKKGAVSANSARISGLGRGFDSLTTDNMPVKKKPLVVRKGEYTSGNTQVCVRPPLREAPETGGKVVIRSATLPERPRRVISRNGVRGTTVLVRTDRPQEQKKYTSDLPLPGKKRYDVRPGRPIVINPRTKK